MFSASVIELHKAPCWYSTPKRRISCSRPGGSASQKLTPLYSTWPRAGCLSPIIWRISVLLPQPLPPMMTKMSPRRMVKLRSWIRTKLP